MVKYNVWLLVFHICQKYALLFIIMAWLLPKNSRTKSTMRKTEIMVKWTVIFKYIITLWCHMIIISKKNHHTRPWESFPVSIWSTCSASLEMCVMLLWQMSTYCHTRWIIEQRWNKQVFNNIFSCLQSLINLYY